MSELGVAPSNEFLEHFEKNYEPKVESYIKEASRQVLATKVLVVVLVGAGLVSILLTSLGTLPVLYPSIIPSTLFGAFVVGLPLF